MKTEGYKLLVIYSLHELCRKISA